MFVLAPVCGEPLTRCLARVSSRTRNLIGDALAGKRALEGEEEMEDNHMSLQEVETQAAIAGSQTSVPALMQNSHLIGTPIP